MVIDAPVVVDDDAVHLDGTLTANPSVGDIGCDAARVSLLGRPIAPSAARERDDVLTFLQTYASYKIELA